MGRYYIVTTSTELEFIIYADNDEQAKRRAQIRVAKIGGMITGIYRASKDSITLN